MRKIDEIILHCTATPEGREVTVAEIDSWHRQRGFDGIGYHYIVHLDGTVDAGRPLAEVGAHCRGHNQRSIGIAYVGGCDRAGDRWNCKCELRQTEADATIPPMPTDADNPQPGLENNPGRDGELFSQKHPYYPSGCMSCPFAGGHLAALMHGLAHKQNCHQCEKVNKVINQKRKEYELRKKEYERYKNDPDYTDVHFDDNTGGYCAIHREHNREKGFVYEEEAMLAGHKNGHVVILDREINSIYKHKNNEGFWDGMLFEVAGRETATKNNIRDGLKHCAKKPGCKIAVLVFPKNNFDINVFNDGLKAYNGLQGDPNQWAHFEKIICIQNHAIIYEKSHQL